MVCSLCFPLFEQSQQVIEEKCDEKSTLLLLIFIGENHDEKYEQQDRKNTTDHSRGSSSIGGSTEEDRHQGWNRGPDKRSQEKQMKISRDELLELLDDICSEVSRVVASHAEICRELAEDSLDRTRTDAQQTRIDRLKMEL